jgi:hypothetical protein
VAGKIERAAERPGGVTALDDWRQIEDRKRNHWTSLDAEPRAGLLDIRYTCRMRRALLIAVLLAASAGAADPDPEGTVQLQLEVGKTAKVTAAPGAAVLCDNTAVAASEFTDDGEGYVLRGRGPGTTLCGVWLAGGVAGGLYRVTVHKAAPREKDGGT